MRRLILVMPLLVVVAVGIVLYDQLGKDHSALDSNLVGKPVPDFELTTLKNPDHKLDSDIFKGDVVLLNVWATWCISCRVEHPELMRLAKEEGVPIIGLNYKNDRQAALKWLDEKGNPYRRTLFDPDGTFGFDLGVYGAPETYIIDDGVVRYRHVGIVNRKLWQEDLQPLLSQYREDH